MKITAIYFSYLRIEAHYQFLILVQKLLAAYPDVAAIMPEQRQKFDNLLMLEGKLVDAVRISQYTEEIIKTNQRIERNLVGIGAMVNAALHHFDSNMVNAARHIKLRLKSFRGEIGQKAYEEEMAAVRILINELQTTYSEQVTLLKLEPWITELAEAKDEFEHLFYLRNVERTQRPQKKLREVKKQIETVYREMVKRIEAYTLIHGEETCDTFIRKLNGEVAYFHEHMHRHAKKDIRKVMVTSIPAQPYDGEPVIVLPAVFYEGEKLVFTTDYEVSYRNNCQPGTAYIIIRGKGKYTNTKTISFNIVEH